MKYLILIIAFIAGFITSQQAFDLEPEKQTISFTPAITPPVVIKPTVTVKPTVKPTFTPTYAPTSTPIEKVETSLNSSIIFSQVNTYRQSQGLSTLSEHDALCSLALIRAKDSVSDWSHNGFFAKAKVVQDNYGFAEVVENLVKDYSEMEVVPAWLDSPTHKRNLDVNLKYGCIRCYQMNCAFIGAR